MIYQDPLCQHIAHEVTLDDSIPIGSAKTLCLEVVLCDWNAVDLAAAVELLTVDACPGPTAGCFTLIPLTVKEGQKP
jgi:hypothetical protein